MWATLTWCSVFSDVVWINLPLLTLHFIRDLCPPESYESRLFYYTNFQSEDKGEREEFIWNDVSLLFWEFVRMNSKTILLVTVVYCFHNEIVLGFRFSPNSVQYSGIFMFIRTLAIVVHFLHFTFLSSVISTPSK